MVLINGVKYACERCIRGHRVTTCNHTDQPLLMIKPKGRPSTTCSYCKELRKNKTAKPPGTCTCGRQEKKRQAQRAKEEARAKAKQQAAHNCTCGTQIVCKIHQKRQQRKNNSLNGNATSILTQRKMKNRSKMNRISSSASLDSHLFSNSSTNNTANMFSSTFLDSDTGAGKISKECHHVPSLASISSLQSSQSLDQNFSPQNTPSMQFSFLSENPATYTKYGQHSKNKHHNWESSRSSMPNRSESQLNLLENTLTSGLDPLKNTRKVQSPNKTNIGEVIVPLEEFIPPNINGIGKVDDIQPWPEDQNIQTQDIYNENNDILPDIRPTSFNKVQLRPNKAPNPLTTGNGLLDMFSDSSSMSTLSRANLLLQEKNDQSNKLNSSNPILTTNGILKDRQFVGAQVPSTRNDYSKSITDNDSVASVEVLSLMPSFMDIPENENDNRRLRKLRTNANANLPYSRQRSSSIDRNHKYPKNLHIATLNPTNINNSLDDRFSVNSFNQPETEIPRARSFLVNNSSNTIPSPKANSFQASMNHDPTNVYNVPNNENADDNLTNMNTNEISTVLSQQTSSPTELLSDQGFAELDNFLSNL